MIHDHDPLFIDDFCQTLSAAGVTALRLPPRSPNLNAYAERFVRSIKEECLNNFIFFSEKQLRHVVKEYVAHCNHERNHQGVGNELIEPKESDIEVAGKIECRERLGGALKFYHRRAA